MPTYERFEDVTVWRQAMELYAVVDGFLDRQPPGISRSLTIQLERAARLIFSNVAKGFERDILAHFSSGHAGYLNTHAETETAGGGGGESDRDVLSPNAGHRVNHFVLSTAWRF